MTLVALTFAISLGTIMGAYWLFVLRPEEQHKAAAVGRLRGYKAAVKNIGIIRAPERLSHIPLLERLLGQRQGITTRIHALIVESGVQITVGAYVLSCFVGGALGAVLTWQVFHILVLSLVVGAAACVLPYAYLRFKRARRLKAFAEQFPEAIDLISRALRAGHAFTTGLSMAADEMPAPVGPEFRRVYDEQNFGMSLTEALRSMAARVPVLDAKFFVTAVLTQRESGGNLSEVLDNLSSVMRDRFKLERQIRVVSAHGRMTAWVLVALPPALAAILFTLSPHLMRVLIEDPLGIQLIVVAGVLQVVGTMIIARMVRLDY